MSGSLCALLQVRQCSGTKALQRLQESPTDVVKVPKSGGCVTHSREEDKLLRDLWIKRYFLGIDGKLTPSLQQLKVSDVKVFKAAGGLGSQTGLLPAGMAAAMDPTRLTPVPITEELVCTPPMHISLRTYLRKAVLLYAITVACWILHIYVKAVLFYHFRRNVVQKHVPWI
jgi:hypothetical protein